MSILSPGLKKIAQDNRAIGNRKMKKIYVPYFWDFTVVYSDGGWKLVDAAVFNIKESASEGGKIFFTNRKEAEKFLEACYDNQYSFTQLIRKKFVKLETINGCTIS